MHIFCSLINHVDLFNPTLKFFVKIAKIKITLEINVQNVIFFFYIKSILNANNNILNAKKGKFNTSKQYTICISIYNKSYFSCDMYFVFCS